MPPKFPVGAAEGDGRALSGIDGLIIAFVFLLASVAAVSSLPKAAPQQGAPIAVLFPPWISRADAIASSFSAGHLVLRTGRLSSIVIVASGTEASTRMIRPAGAWMTLALAGLAGCLDTPTTLEPSP
jgi:hypothetical protein